MYWKHHSTKSNPALSPVDPYDKEGAFTGCFLPQGVNGGSEEMSVIYSSINYLPIHWTIPYVRGCEGVAIATSKDGGATWNKLAQNPIVEEEPPDLDVTGYRDPYVAPWAALDKIRGSARALYGVVSGGVRGKGPTAFFYAIDPCNLAQWSYLGPLMDIQTNLRKSLKWGGDFGVNWECAAFMTLNAHEAQHAQDFVITGTEGGVERPWVKSYLADKPDDFPRRTTRYGIWIAGSPTKRGNNGSIAFTHEFDGILDHGCFYASNTFYDPVKERRVLWGWLPEEDLPIEHCKEKGWNGSLGVPREIYLYRTTGVTGALRSSLGDITSIRATSEGSGETYTVETLGVSPLPDLSVLRTCKPHTLESIRLPQVSSTMRWTPFRGKKWEMKATINITEGCSSVGMIIKHNHDHTIGTSIKFYPQQEEFVVDRSKSNNYTKINKCEERGSFTLFRHKAEVGEILEKLQLHIFCDEDILEVFANGRFVLSTMVYTDEPGVDGISLLGEGSEGCARFEEVEFWSEVSKIFSH